MLRQATSTLAVALTILASAGPATGQDAARGKLPFDLTREDILQVDLEAVTWIDLDRFVGGMSGVLRYDPAEPEPGACRAVALIGLWRLRNRYVEERNEAPVTLRLVVTCADAYRARANYDGVNAHMEVRERTSGRVIYRARRRGLPSFP